jgi:hypothetical protein
MVSVDLDPSWLPADAGSPIQQALPHMGPADVAEVIAILGRISAPDTSVPA